VYERGPECGVLLLPQSARPEPLDQGGYFRPYPRATKPSTCAAMTVLALEQMGIYVEFSHHEVAPSQQKSTCATPMRSPWPTR